MTKIVVELGWFDFPQSSFKTVSYKEETMHNVWHLIPNNAQLEAEYDTDDGMGGPPNLFSARTLLAKEQAVPVVDAWVRAVQNRYNWRVRAKVDGPHQYSVTLTNELKRTRPRTGAYVKHLRNQRANYLL